MIYLQGSSLSNDDLWRARVNSASAVFVMVPSNTSDMDPKYDVGSNLITTSLRYFDADIPIYSQGSLFHFFIVCLSHVMGLARCPHCAGFDPDRRYCWFLL